MARLLARQVLPRAVRVGPLPNLAMIVGIRRSLASRGGLLATTVLLGRSLASRGLLATGLRHTRRNHLPSPPLVTMMIIPERRRNLLLLLMVLSASRNLLLLLIVLQARRRNQKINLLL